MKHLPLCIILLFCCKSIGQNSKLSCDCLIFPISQDCFMICLRTANTQELIKGYKMTPKIAGEISKIPNRRTIKTISDLKTKLSKQSYEQIVILYDNSIKQSNVNGTNIGRDQININNHYYNGGSGNTPNIDIASPSAPDLNITTKILRNQFTANVFDIQINLYECTLRNRKLVILFTYEYIGPSPSITINFKNNSTQMVDANGNVFNSTRSVVANVEGGKYKLSYYELIKGVKVKSKVEFDVSDDNLKISRLEYAKGYYFYDVPVSK